MKTLAAASLALAGATLTSAPAAAHGGHHGHRCVYIYTGYYSGYVCFVVRRKLFIPGFGFVVPRQRVCE